MKILLYAEPTTILSFPHPITIVLRNFFYKWLAKYLLKYEDVEVKTIIPEITFMQNEKFHHIDELNPILFKDSYLEEIFPNARSVEEMSLKIFNSELNNDEHFAFQKIMSKLLQDWKPDIVINFPMHNDLIKQAYPEALNLMVENGIFSRPPFCRALRYEPIHFMNGFLNKYENDIRNFFITEEQRKELNNFKKYLKKIVNIFNPQKKILKQLRKRFKYLLLCPVPTDNLYKETYYDDQYLYLLDVLNKIPDDVGLIITFHDQVYSQLNAGIIKTLQQKYKNLIWFPVKDNAVVSQSLNYFEYCDAIINMHTMTGTQAMLWDLKVISLDKRYSKWFCDKQGLENLEEFLESPKKDNSNILYWYLTHFAIFEHSMGKSDWYYNFFSKKLAKYRANGITFDLFEQIEDFSSISKFVLAYVALYYLIGQHLYKFLCFIRKFKY